MKYLLLEKRDNYLVATFNRGKANPLNYELLTEIRQLLADTTADDRFGGIVLNGKEHYFSAGLDVVEMYSLDEEGIRRFLLQFRSMVKDLIHFPKALIASITGHSPAGGCVIASCCDYRVMAKGEYIIGFNEIPIGMVVPTYIYEMFKQWVGAHKAYQYILEGKLLKADEAHTVGLVDELVPFSEVLSQAEAKMQHYLQFSWSSWQQSKNYMRKDLRASIEEEAEELMEASLKLWWHPDNRAAMKRVVERVTKR